MVRMRTRIPHNYGHRKVPAGIGEEFDCEPGHVRAMLVYADVVERDGTYNTRVMTAAKKKKKGKR